MPFVPWRKVRRAHATWSLAPKQVLSDHPHGALATTAASSRVSLVLDDVTGACLASSHDITYWPYVEKAPRRALDGGAGVSVVTAFEVHEWL